ncbi:MAG TPA: response regulator transcription factor [Terriglobia bacterium]|nr:response regulator transcription factor [Terriglobia bacterium]
MAEPIRICIVEDHALVRSGLRMLIENTNERMCVVGEAANRAEAFEAASRSRPDIFILDLDLKHENGLDFLEDLITTFAPARVLVVTGSTDTNAHQRAIATGAMGIVLKEQASEALITAIERVHSGEIWLTRSMTSSILSRVSTGPADSEVGKIEALTRREREIIVLVAQGMKRSQIADKLFISETTVRNHLTSILSKLQLTDRFDLVFYAFRHGLAKPPR